MLTSRSGNHPRGSRVRHRIEKDTSQTKRARSSDDKEMSWSRVKGAQSLDPRYAPTSAPGNRTPTRTIYGTGLGPTEAWAPTNWAAHAPGPLNGKIKPRRWLSGDKPV